MRGSLACYQWLAPIWYSRAKIMWQDPGQRGHLRPELQDKILMIDIRRAAKPVNIDVSRARPSRSAERLILTRQLTVVGLRGDVATVVPFDAVREAREIWAYEGRRLRLACRIFGEQLAERLGVHAAIGWIEARRRGRAADRP